MKTSGSFFKEQMLVILISNGAALLTYVNQVLIARSLSPSAFASVAAVLSMAPLIFSVLSAFPLLATKVLKENQPSEVLEIIFSTALIFSILFLLSFGVFARFFQNWIQVDSHWAFYLLIMQIFLMFFVNFYSGILLAKGMYPENSMKDFSIAGFKLIFSFLGLQIFTGSFLVPLVSECISALIVTCLLIFFLKKQLLIIPNFKFSKAIFSKENFYRFSFIIPAASASWIIGALLSFDIPSSKAIFSAHVAGEYSGASTLGKVGYFVSAAIAQVAFASSLGNTLETKRLWKILWVNFSITLGIASAVAGVYAFWGEMLILTLFGKPYTPGAIYLPKVTLAMGLLSFMSTLINIALARQKYILIYTGLLTTIICNLMFFGGTKYQSPNEFSTSIIKFFATMVIFFVTGLIVSNKQSEHPQPR